MGYPQFILQILSILVSNSTEDFLHNSPRNIRKSLIPTVMKIRQQFVIEAEDVQQRRV